MAKIQQVSFLYKSVAAGLYYWWSERVGLAKQNRLYTLGAETVALLQVNSPKYVVEVFRHTWKQKAEKRMRT